MQRNRDSSFSMALSQWPILCDTEEGRTKKSRKRKGIHYEAKGIPPRKNTGVAFAIVRPAWAPAMSTDADPRQSIALNSRLPTCGPVASTAKGSQTAEDPGPYQHAVSHQSP
jgi:hypothetical protein